ncbi:5-oxoprolinase subunit PxpB [Bradyrhizobium sp.]|uniref:5-oxoprolinase subunit PxpB n=1 Tax=Bradyrhizobium sp. TaxID=376 RepID=UPI0025C01756|nr:5-oxoprolinase subunit PxpB [Bradyrhizobium sp.]
MDDFRILKAADSALVIEFGAAIDRGISDRVLALAETLTNAGLPGATEIVATFRSLCVNYDSLVTTGADLERAIAELLKGSRTSSQIRRLWDIPVCYDPPHAPDIEEVANSVGLTAAEVATLHAGTQYHVYMIGFVPGYPYMGDLPAKLRLPRRLDPRTRVPPGSLAIATSMTAVYPYESPGGWHLIGTSPVSFFDPDSAKGALLGPGDAVKFRAVTEGEFSRIRLAVERNDYVPESTEIAA